MKEGGCRMDRTLSKTCTDQMCGLLHGIVNTSFWISQMVQLNPCRPGFNNLCLPDTKLASNFVASGVAPMAGAGNLLRARAR